MRQVGFVIPGSANEAWTDTAIELLVGQTCTFTFFSDEPQNGKIIAATRKPHDDMVPGIWVTIEVDE